MKHIILMTSLLLLTACTSYKEGFDCDAIPGVGCRSISEVDKMIDEGKIGADDTSNKKPNPQEESKGDNKHLSFIKDVHVWIAPYSDDEGTTHGAQNLFVPIKPRLEGVE